MSKIKNIVAGLGLATGFTAMIVPMTTFATGVSASDTLDVEVNVGTVISMRIVSNSAEGTKTTTCDSRNIVETGGVITNDGCTGDTQSVSTTIYPGMADTSSMTTNIYVSTNSTDGYSLTLNDTDTNNSLVTADGDSIAAISSEPVGGSNPGWAVSKDSGATWSAVPASNSSALVIKNYSPDPKATTTDDQSTINYGVAASLSQASGTYTDTIVYTATAH